MQTSNYNYSITGDNNVTRATVIPALNSIKSDKFNVVNDLGILNTWQGVTLDDLFYDRLPIQHVPFSINDDFIEFTITLEGLVHMKEIGLDIQLNLSYTTDSKYNEGDKFSHLVQGQLAFLDVFKNVEVRLGNNGFRPSNLEMESVMGMKMHAINKIRNLEESKSFAGWGNIYANGAIFKSFAEASDTLIATNIDGIDDSNKYYDDMHSIIFKKKTSYITNSTVNLYLGINDIVPFFNQDAYLPKGTYINIRLFFKKEDDYNFSYINANNSTGSIGTRGISKLGDNFVNNQQIYCAYTYYLLKDDAKKTFDMQWLAKPLLYNSLYYQVKQIKMDGISTKYSFSLEPSTEVPLEIMFVLQKVYENGNPIDLTLDGFANFNNSHCCGYKYNYIRIKQNGRIIENFEPLAKATYAFRESYSQLVVNNIRYARNDNNVYPWNTALSKMCGGLQAIPFSVVLTKSKFYSKGEYGTSAGAATITIETDISTILTGSPLNTKYSLMLYCKYPSQIALDTSFKFVEAQWPILLTTNGPVVTPTINVN